MAKKQPFALVYASAVKSHLQAIDSKHHSSIQTAIATSLFHQPDVESRNRKPLTRPIGFGAEWELRCGPKNCFRVFYLVDAESREVEILAIGVKERSRLYFGGEELEE